MDHVFNPKARKWISPLTHLGNSMEELKHLVRLQKESLTVLDPAVSTNRSQQWQSNREPSTLALEYPGYENWTVEAQARRLQAEIDKYRENNWSADETACTDAVAAVGGPDFFKFDKTKDAHCTVIGAPITRKRQRRPKKVDTTLQQVKTEKETVAYTETDNENTSIPQTPQEECPIANIYEAYNYGDEGDLSLEGEDELLLNETIDEAEIRKITETLPAALDDSDEEDAHWINMDNDISNFTNAAERYDFFRTRYREREQLEHSESEEDEVVLSSEEEGEPTQTCTSDAGFESASCTPSEKVTSLGTLLNVLRSDSREQQPETSSSARGLRSSQKISSRIEQIKTEPVEIIDPIKDSDSVDSSHPNAKADKTASSSQGEGEQKEKSGNPDPTNDTQTKQERAEGATDFRNFTDWSLNLAKKRDEEYKRRIRPDLMKRTGRFENSVRDLQKRTSANLASVKGEVFQHEPVLKSSSMPLLAPPIDSKITLQSLAIFLTHGEDPSRFPWKSVNVQQQMNDDFANSMFLKRMEQQKIDIKNPALAGELVKKEEDFVVQLLVYHATDPEEVLPDEVKMFVEPKLAYELSVLGSQTVAELMNAIHCENDHVYLKEVEHPDQFVEDPEQYAKKKFPKSLMLIHNTIYHDQRAPNEDYVTVINDWAKKLPEKRIGEFTSGDMNTQLKNIELRFGYPYVYIHLGACEHIIVFTKARLLHGEDEHLIKSYPKISTSTRFKNVYCRVDNEYLARWAVLDYKEFPENPMLLCTDCVTMYCYDSKKKKRGNFRLYPFTQLANIL